MPTAQLSPIPHRSQFYYLKVFWVVRILKNIPRKKNFLKSGLLIVETDGEMLSGGRRTDVSRLSLS